MPKLIAASIAVAALAIIATLIAVIEESSRPEPPPTLEPQAVFSRADEEGTQTTNACHSNLVASPPPRNTEGTESASASTDRAIYECLFVHTRPGILSPEKMPQNRISQNMSNMSRAPAAKQCRDDAAMSPKEDLVSVAAANQIRNRVFLCYSNLPATPWHEINTQQRVEISDATADLLTAYAYSYHRLSQEQALQCRIIYRRTAEAGQFSRQPSERKAMIIAESARREYCNCVLHHLGVKTENPLRWRSC